MHLRRLATAFRAALESTDLSTLHLDSFPAGACGHASRLLAQFIIDSGLDQATYVMGRQEEPFRTHAWLELGKVLIDVTADQFQEMSEKVVVTDTHPSWYDEWIIDNRTEEDVGLCYYSGLAGASDLYATLKSAANAVLLRGAD